MLARISGADGGDTVREIVTCNSDVRKVRKDEIEHTWSTRADITLIYGSTFAIILARVLRNTGVRAARVTAPRALDRVK